MSGDGVTEKKSIYVRWVRSGIGFSYRQKRIVRSLGLRRLNHVVELEDTPANRGLVAKIPHLVEITTPPAAPVRAAVAEYTIKPAADRPAAKPAQAAKTGEAAATPAKPEETSEVQGAQAADEPVAPLAKPKRARKKKEPASETADDSSASGTQEKSEE